MLKVGDRVRIKDSTKQELRNWGTKPYTRKLSSEVLDLLNQEFSTIKKIHDLGGSIHGYQLEGIIAFYDNLGTEGNITFGVGDFDFNEINACNCPMSQILAQGCKIHD